MKKLLTAMILAIVATPSYAMHAYRNERCSFNLPGNDKVMVLHRRLFDNIGTIETEAVETPASGNLLVLYSNIATPEAVSKTISTGEEPLALDVVYDGPVTSFTPYDDGCWQGKVDGLFEREVRITRIFSADFQRAPGLMPGQTLKLKCSFEDIVPSGPDCGK